MEEREVDWKANIVERQNGWEDGPRENFERQRCMLERETWRVYKRDNMIEKEKGKKKLWDKYVTQCRERVIWFVRKRGLEKENNIKWET